MLGDDAEFVRDVGDQQSLLLERRKRVFDVVASASSAKDSDLGTSQGGAIETLRVGPASDPTSQVGPLVSARAAEGVRVLISQATAEGAD